MTDPGQQPTPATGPIDPIDPIEAPIGRRRFLRLALAAGVGAAAAGGVAAYLLTRSDEPEQFRVVDGRIVGPGDAPFLSLGANVVNRPSPMPDWWAPRPAVNGRVAEATAWGWNTIRLHLSVDAEAAGVPRQHLFDGVLETIEEFTSAGFVVIPVSFDHQFANPTFDDVVRSGVVDLQDAIVDAHGDNPYLWLNPLDEQTGRDGLDLWSSTGRALHDRARDRGFAGVFVWDLPQFGQGLELIADTDLGERFAAATTNTAFGWHNFGSHDAAQQDEWAQRVIDRGLAVHIGGFGEGWDPSRPSQSDGWPTMDRDERRGTDWVLSRFFEFGFGAVVWHGTGYVGGDHSRYSLRAGDNLAFYDDEVPLSPLGERFLALGRELAER